MLNLPTLILVHRSDRVYNLWIQTFNRLFVAGKQNDEPQMTVKRAKQFLYQERKTRWKINDKKMRFFSLAICPIVRISFNKMFLLDVASLFLFFSLLIVPSYDTFEFRWGTYTQKKKKTYMWGTEKQPNRNVFNSSRELMRYTFQINWKERDFHKLGFFLDNLATFTDMLWREVVERLLNIPQRWWSTGCEKRN